MRSSANFPTTNNMKLVNSKYYKDSGDVLMGGRILLEEIPATLAVVSEILYDAGIVLERPIVDCLLGSTGKKPSSGDIDLGVWPFSDIQTAAIKRHPQVFKVSRAGSVVSMIIAIQGTGEVNAAQDRNGLVQVDLIPGDLNWLKQFFFADESSGFKGAHRNLLISAYLMHFRREHTPDGWKVWSVSNGPIFSQNHGFADRKQTRRTNADGVPYATKFDTEYTNKMFNVEDAAEYYFGNHYRDAFTSVETLYQAIEENYDRDIAQSIYRRYLQDYLSPHLLSADFPWYTVPNIPFKREMSPQ